MDIRRPLSVALATLAAAALCDCSRAPEATAQPSPVIAAPAAVPAPPPAKKAVMICRSSVDGRKAACGTPNAVMVGIKTD